MSELEQLRQQLAAEKEKAESFAAALDEIATTGADTLDGYDAANIATAALARFNAGKKGEGDTMSNKPTGEWMLSYTPFGLVQYPDGSKAVMAWNEAEAKRLVEWHDAALAAERSAYTKMYEDYVSDMEKQLAAEREKSSYEHGQRIRIEAERNQLRKQLAAEREKSDELTKQIAIGLKCENQLREQLADERENLVAVQELVLKRDADIACLKAQLTSVDTSLFGELKSKGYEPDRSLVVEQLKQQLAAERENSKTTIVEAIEKDRFDRRDVLNWEVGYKCGKAECAGDIRELREQLAAERKEFQRQLNAYKELYEPMANAEREKLENKVT